MSIRDWFNGLFQRGTLEDPATELTADELASYLGATWTAETGVEVNTTYAMRIAAVFACVRILAETISTLPLHTYKRLERGKERATRHPLYSVLHNLPNPYMTAQELRENMVGHACLWGVAYAEVVRDGSGQVRELWPLIPSSVVYDDSGGGPRWYYTASDGTSYWFGPGDLWRWRAFGTDSLVGMSVISQAREAMGLALAAEQHGATFFANDASPGGVLVHPGKLNKPARDNLKTSWEAAHKGLDYAHRVAVLEEGVQWQQTGLPNDDAQWLETRKFQIQEIARMFRVPPHMLADLDRATFSNIEHQSIEFVEHTIRPWLVRIEQTIYRDLLTTAERRQYFAEHLVDGLLRGDITSRYQAYSVARQNGWMSANDIRELENMNPLPGDQGDIYLVPLNMIPADEVGMGYGGYAPQAAPPDVSGSGDRALGPLLLRASSAGSALSRRRIERSYRRLVADATGRILRREEADIMRQAEKLLARNDYGGFVAWLEEFYEGHPEFYRGYMEPVLASLAEQIAADAAAEIAVDSAWSADDFMHAYALAAGQAYSGSHLGQLEQLLREAEAAEIDALEALEGRMGEWQERSPGKQAVIHTVRTTGAVTREVWNDNGVRTLVWETHGENCPYCNALRGKTITIYSSFLGKGEAFQPEGANAPLSPSSDIGHPPAHLHCDCGLRPGV